MIVDDLRRYDGVRVTSQAEIAQQVRNLRGRDVSQSFFRHCRHRTEQRRRSVLTRLGDERHVSTDEHTLRRGSKRSDVDEREVGVGLYVTSQCIAERIDRTASEVVVNHSDAEAAAQGGVSVDGLVVPLGGGGERGDGGAR